MISAKDFKKTEKIISSFFKKMDIEIESEFKKNSEGIEINLRPKDESLSPLLIGYRGQNLRAIQHILRVMTRNEIKNAPRIDLDIGGYKLRYTDSIKEFAKSLAEKVKKTGRVELLRPMSAYERRIVHLIVKEIPGIVTQSVGEDPNRRVIIKPQEVKSE